MTGWMQAVLAITEERSGQHGLPLINFLRASVLWSAYKPNEKFSPVDVALMMNLFKIARETGGHKADNPIDMIGYIHCWGVMDDQMKALGYEDGCEAFKQMGVDDMLRLIRTLEKEQEND